MRVVSRDRARSERSWMGVRILKEGLVMDRGGGASLGVVATTRQLLKLDWYLAQKSLAGDHKSEYAVIEESVKDTQINPVNTVPQ
jgi:hypothetical protein